MKLRTKPCTIPGCKNFIDARGWCTTHYERWRKNGNPLAVKTQTKILLPYIYDVVMRFEGTECFLWPFKSNVNGYGTLKINSKTQLVTRIVCREAHGEPPTPQHEAAHSCGKGHMGCCNKHHLSWKTHAENVADQKIHGTVASGERNGHAKITNKQAKEIRKIGRSKPQSAIARQYGIDQAAVSRIINGQSYKEEPSHG